MKNNTYRLFSLVLCLLLTGLLLAGCSSKPQPAEGAVACAAFSGKASDAVSFEEPLILDFSGDKSAADKFNRFDLEYELSAPVKGAIAYELDGEAYSEEFYLSETETAFSQLIDGYLAGQTAADVSSITFTPLQPGPVTLRLKNAALAVQEVLPDEYVLENDRYKLGIRLSWGGGISLLEDKNCPREDISNLLNNFDTGRLIQQSYYGVTDKDGYESGTYNGNVWPYNPVQGGDLTGNKSKLVAVEIGEDHVTLTSRPLDWAKENTLTYAYYSNTYTLQGDLIRVDNSVIDFSGFDNPIRHQELPAFYTISALGNFVFYDGSKPWTDAELRWERELAFWGGNQDAYFNVLMGNTETWCAWVDDSDYGVGLYTPGVEILLAGRHSYNGSTRADNAATNYVAPLCTIKLPCYQKLSYSYLVSAGTVEQIRGSFAANKDFAANEDLSKVYD